MQIIKAAQEQLELVKEITRKTISEIYPHYYPQGVVDFFLAHHKAENIVKDIDAGIVYLAMKEGKGIGTVTIRENDICRLFVLPEYQHKGVGSRLLDFAENLIGEKYAEILIDSSLPAKRIYLKRGYVAVENQTIVAENGDILVYDVMKKIAGGNATLQLKLVKASNTYHDQIIEMLEEWYTSGEKIIPYAIRRLDYHNFEYYCKNLEVRDAQEGLVPDSTYFCLDEERNIMVGAVNIRHYLNDALLLNGGHIGDGVRPSERRKGIATRMIFLALEECKKLGIEKVLMVCDKENIGSAKSIIKNGGILENEVVVDGIVEQRYWIDLVNVGHEGEEG